MDLLVGISLLIISGFILFFGGMNIFQLIGFSEPYTIRTDVQMLIANSLESLKKDTLNPEQVKQLVTATETTLRQLLNDNYISSDQLKAVINDLEIKIKASIIPSISATDVQNIINDKLEELKKNYSTTNEINIIIAQKLSELKNSLKNTLSAEEINNIINTSLSDIKSQITIITSNMLTSAQVNSIALEAIKNNITMFLTREQIQTLIDNAIKNNSVSSTNIISALTSMDTSSTLTLKNFGLKVGRHYDATIPWGIVPATTLFLGWNTGQTGSRTVIGNNKFAVIDTEVSKLPADTIHLMNDTIGWGDTKLKRDLSVDGNINIKGNSTLSAICNGGNCLNMDDFSHTKSLGPNGDINATVKLNPFAIQSRRHFDAWDKWYETPALFLGWFTPKTIIGAGSGTTSANIDGNVRNSASSTIHLMNDTYLWDRKLCFNDICLDKDKLKVLLGIK